MATDDIEALRLDYKKAVDALVAAIRAEEALATSDHSMIAMEKWDAADFTVQDAKDEAIKRRELYKDALRKVNYGI
jgi:hypothetical protein